MSGIKGSRLVEDEKRVLTELGRLFHIAKANSKEVHNTASSTAAAPSATTGKSKDKKTKGKKHASRRGSQRRSKHGGSIWIVLKGGFSARTLPLSTNTSQIQQRATERAKRSEQRRVAAIEMAESYIQSAWQNAEEAGLVTKDASTGERVPTAEGHAYLREQYSIAARMLRPAAVGSALQSVVSAATASSAAAAAATTTTTTTTPLTAYAGTVSRSTWESVIPRELAILNYGVRATADAEDKARAEVEAATKGFYFALAEPVATAQNSASQAAVDVVPTKCIMRVSNSQRQRHTAVLSSAKAVNYFKSNFMAVLRKELSGSKLPRGAEESLDPAENAAAAAGTEATASGKGAKAANRGQNAGKGGKQHKKK